MFLVIVDCVGTMPHLTILPEFTCGTLTTPAHTHKHHPSFSPLPPPPHYHHHHHHPRLIIFARSVCNSVVSDTSSFQPVPRSSTIKMDSPPTLFTPTPTPPRFRASRIIAIWQKRVTVPRFPQITTNPLTIHIYPPPTLCPVAADHTQWQRTDVHPPGSIK